MKKPSLCIFMIVKNEERDLPRCLESVRSIADKVVIVDTGSIDNTVNVAHIAARDFLTYVSYTKASEKDENGDWKLQDFSAARNHSVELAEASGCTHLMWMDADDELLDPAAIKRAMYRDDIDVWSVFMQSGHHNSKWLHYRMWRNGTGVRFHGRVHEWPKIDGLRKETCYATIRHHADPDANQENSNVRNLRLLHLQWQDSPDDMRTAFYLGCTYRDGGQHEEAAQWFQKRLDLGEGYRDEALFAWLYLARSLAALERNEEALRLLYLAIRHQPDWAEFPMCAAEIHYKLKDYNASILYALGAFDQPIPATALWREVGAYRDQPPRWISWCHEHMGNIENAVHWAEKAAERIEGHDAQWQQRIERLQAQFAAKYDPVPVKIKNARRKVALVRPGAIGDILMTLNLVPLFKEANPDADVTFFCAAEYGKPDSLLPFILAAGCVRVMDSANINAWAKSFDQVINLVGYPLHEGYPRGQIRQHLLYYFAEEMGLDLRKVGLPQLSLPRPRRIIEGNEPYVTIQMKAGWSHYKEWQDWKWDDTWSKICFSQLLSGSPDLILIGDPHKRTLSESIGIIANSSMHVGIDSFANHLTNYLWTDDRGARTVPGVILWGSTQPTASGYGHNRNIWKGLPCSPCFKENPAVSQVPNGICNVPSIPIRSYGDGLHRCMDLIQPDEVIEAIFQTWEEINKA